MTPPHAAVKTGSKRTLVAPDRPETERNIFGAGRGVEVDHLDLEGAGLGLEIHHRRIVAGDTRRIVGHSELEVAAGDAKPTQQTVHLVGVPDRNRVEHQDFLARRLRCRDPIDERRSVSDRQADVPLEDDASHRSSRSFRKPSSARSVARRKWSS